jgi:repressor LexA
MSPRQKQVFDFIQAYIKLKGYAPSYMNIAQGLELKSKSNIHRLVHKLKEEGLLHVKPHEFRSLKVIDKTVGQMVKL